ncbi:Domain of unknown function DUF4376 [uncultured Caudovirales phage]|uniref:DUF4376 domain-containing protein n=1 Tax=uncultured Caudovirales phage TaxID=2100421 RepID=A0A6J5L8X6_9CAUD|nr:Domain of unknown function DUF4376 [uncultured Caudovirales phage]
MITQLYFFDASGKCVRKYTCSPEMAQARVEQEKPVASIISDQSIDPRNARLVAGLLLDLPQPSPLHTWDGSEWQPPAAPAALAAAKAVKITAIKAERSAAEFAPLVWKGSTFDADADAQRRILIAMTYALSVASAKPPITLAVDWILADGTTRTMSGDDLIAIGSALALRQNTIATTAKARKNAVGAATTPEQVTGA